MVDEKIEIFGLDIVKAYELSLNEAYEFVKANTNYLDNIDLNNIKDIKFSCFKDIYILLKDGNLYIDGEYVFHDIKSLGLWSGINIFAITNDNIIISITGKDSDTDLIKNNNYKYKKIIIDVLSIVALTNEKTIKVYGLPPFGIVDYTKFFDIDDIGYNEKTEEFVIFKNNKIESLFGNKEYKKSKNIITKPRENEKYLILSNDI